MLTSNERKISNIHGVPLGNCQLGGMLEVPQMTDSYSGVIAQQYTEAAIKLHSAYKPSVLTALTDCEPSAGNPRINFLSGVTDFCNSNESIFVS